MPSHRCKHPSCPAILPAAGYCPAHAAGGRSATSARQTFYDQHQRDPEAKKFYNSAAWKRVRAAVLAEEPVCRRCQVVFAAHVHHKKPLKQCSSAEKLDRANLMPLCIACHNAVEAGAASIEDKGPAVFGILAVVEDEEYTYDADAAEKPIAFIETYCRHYEGSKWAGQPFKLLDWQKHIIRTLFGWKSRATGLRRFRELYLLTAKGAGKTPMLAGIGLYMLLADGEPGAHVISMASSFEQANYTFSGGKAYIAECPKLQEATQVCQYIIKGKGKRHRHGKWTIVSGKPNGRSGSRPSCIIADEVHEWPAWTGQSYELLTANLFKRSQPLLLVATNAGADQMSFARQLHERAMKVLSGDSEEKTILPVICEAPGDLDWTSEEAAAAANPSLGQIVSFEQLRPAIAKAKGSPAAEADYRRLYLSQWITGTSRWLDMTKWDAVTRAAIDTAAMKDAPLYIGLDLSQGDDLCAAAYVWVTPDFYTADARFWLPKLTAQHYQAKNGTPFQQWADDKHIELLDEATVSMTVRLRIADSIIATSKVTKLIAVCYDRYKAEDCIARIEAAGVKCIPVPQGYTLSPGCDELERRMTEQSIAIAPNPVLRWNAENVEVTTDARGNRWPVKPNAKGRYAGKRSAKIDGVASLVTALTEARKHNFPPAKKQWAGMALVI